MDERIVREGLKGHDTSLSFRLVAALPEAIEFAPLGKDSLLVADSCSGPQPLLIQANQLRFLPGLAGVARESWMTCVSSIGGTWPDSTWSAVSSSSDAGPSSSDVYQWAPDKGWILRHEYDPWVFELVPWRGNVVFLSKCQACTMPQRPKLALRSPSGAWLEQPQPTACQLPLEKLAPAWLAEGTLSLFGYECDSSGELPRGGRVLVMETWSSGGRKTVHRMPLPKGYDKVQRLIHNEKGWAALLSSPAPAHPRLAQFVNNGWSTVTELPDKFKVLSAPGSGDLWGVVGGYLLRFSNPDWAITKLPHDAQFGGISWESVWQRGPKDLWLIGKVGAEPARYFLFNTADGRVDQAFPSEVERERSRPPAKDEEEPAKPVTCLNPFADLLKLTPFQLGCDSSIEMSPEDARRVLKTVLTRRPEFRHLEFVRHRCRGENCIGAIFKNVQQAVELRKELEATIGTIVKADTSNGGPPPTWLLSYDDPRCQPPPETTPFPVLR